MHSALISAPLEINMITIKQSSFIDYYEDYLNKQKNITGEQAVHTAVNSSQMDMEKMQEQERLLHDLNETCNRYKRIAERLPHGCAREGMLGALNDRGEWLLYLLTVRYGFCLQLNTSNTSNIIN